MPIMTAAETIFATSSHKQTRGAATKVMTGGQRVKMPIVTAAETIFVISIALVNSA